MLLNFVENKMPIDKSWMNLPTRSCIECINGVENFLEYEFDHVKYEGMKINCPCVDCWNRYGLNREEFNIHCCTWELCGLIPFGIYMAKKIVVMKIVIRWNDVDMNKVNDMVNMIGDIYPHMADEIEQNANDHQEPNEDAKYIFKLLDDAK